MRWENSMMSLIIISLSPSRVLSARPKSCSPCISWDSEPPPLFSMKANRAKTPPQECLYTTIGLPLRSTILLLKFAKLHYIQYLDYISYLDSFYIFRLYIIILFISFLLFIILELLRKKLFAKKNTIMKKLKKW